MSIPPIDPHPKSGAPGQPRQPVFTDEVDELFVFDERDTRNDPDYKPLPKPIFPRLVMPSDSPDASEHE
jgi:hypothetical protein